MSARCEASRARHLNDMDFCLGKLAGLRDDQVSYSTITGLEATAENERSDRANVNFSTPADEKEICNDINAAAARHADDRCHLVAKSIAIAAPIVEKQRPCSAPPGRSVPIG